MPAKRKYTKDILEKAVKNSVSVREIAKYFGLRAAGGTHNNFTKLIKEYSIDTSHFLGKGANRGDAHKGGPKKKTAQEILVIYSFHSPKIKKFQLVRALNEIGRNIKCEKCGLKNKWNKKEINLQIDHINGMNWDNRAENLRYLCPNCHSQTETFGSKNRPLYSNKAERQE